MSFVHFVSMYLGNKLLGVGSLGGRASGCSLQFRMHKLLPVPAGALSQHVATICDFFKTSLEDKQVLSQNSFNLNFLLGGGARYL